MIRSRTRLGVAVTTVAAAVLLAACGGSSNRRAYSFGPAPTDAPPTVALPKQPSAPRARELRARHVAAGNRALRKLLARSPHALAGSSVWSGIDGRALGVVLTYTLRHPITVDDDLPYAAIPPDAPAHGDCVTPYARGWNHLHAAGVSAIKVLVDLRVDRVADISTNATRGTVSPVAHLPYPSCDENTSGSD